LCFGRRPVERRTSGIGQRINKDEGLNGPRRARGSQSTGGETANWPALFTVSETERDVLPLPVVVLAKLTVSL
jgi:hypothetical protein